jgi:integrase/recombinase XerD
MIYVILTLVVYNFNKPERRKIMFNQLFKSNYHITKHINAPLLEARLNYLQYWHELGRSSSTLMTIEQYLIRIVEYLQLDIKNIVTMEEVEVAADLWARCQSNHSQKQAAFSKSGKKRFTWYATHWLEKLGWLERPVKTVIPVFQKIFMRSHTINRHSTAPLLEERLMYLQHWNDGGAAISTLRVIAQYLLVIMRCLDFYQVRIVTLNEIEKAADCWARDPQNIHKKNKYSKFIKKNLFEMLWGGLKCLAVYRNQKSPFHLKSILINTYPT